MSTKYIHIYIYIENNLRIARKVNKKEIHRATNYFIDLCGQTHLVADGSDVTGGLYMYFVCVLNDAHVTAAHCQYM